MQTVKRAALTTAEDGHTHLLPFDSAGLSPADNHATHLEGLSTPASASDGTVHQHPWVMRADGTIEIGAAEGHTHALAAFSTTVEERNRRLERERAQRQRQQRDSLTPAQEEREIRDRVRREAEEREREQRRSRIEAEARREEAERRQSASKREDRAMEDLHRLHSEAASLAHSLIEKERREGEDYAAAARRLDVEQSQAGEQFRKAVVLADQNHRRASDAALVPSSLSDRFTVHKRLENGMAQVSLNETEAEAELDALAKSIMAKDGCDYYTAYQRAAEQRPDCYAKAVVG